MSSTVPEPLTCPHCRRALTLAKPHCDPRADGTIRDCDWLTCPCGARIAPATGEHSHTEHNTPNDTCQTPTRKEPR